MSLIRYIRRDPATVPNPPSGYVYQGVDLSGVPFIKDSSGTVISFADAAQDLDGLTDVTLTAVADGEILAYNNGSSQWVNVTPTLNALKDVTITTPATGQLLRYSGTIWQNVNFTDLWQEDFTSVAIGTNNVWTVRNLGASYANKVVEMLFSSQANNRTCGVRVIGSSNNRTAEIDNDCTLTQTVKADSNGDIEIFSNNWNQLTLYIQSIWG